MRRFAIAGVLLGILIGGVAPVAALPGPGAGSMPAAPSVEDYSKSLIPTRKAAKVVYLVPDEATFLYQLSNWDAETFYPILFIDSPLAGVFIRGFEPDEIYVADAVKPKYAGMEAVYRAVSSALTDDDISKAPADSAEDYLKLLKEIEDRGPGVVITSADSKTLLGAAVLAAGHKQYLAEYSYPKKYGARLLVDEMNTLRAEVEKLVADTGFTYKDKRDEVDFLTIATDIPMTIDGADAEKKVTRRPVADKTNFAVDDWITRNEDLIIRWGFAGRLVGDRDMAVHQAMCALFLQPKNAFFFSRYAQNNAAFGPYDTLEPSKKVAELVPTENVSSPGATLVEWRKRVGSGNDYWFVYVNSSGGARSWSMNGAGATHDDVPITKVPCIVNYNHSGSAGNPFSRDTIAGRWLANGAYIYYGSHAEPYLSAFLQPSLSIPRMLEGVPLGEAFRWPENRGIGVPWRLVYLGDPMYILRFGAKAEFAEYEDADADVLDSKSAKKLSPRVKTANKFLHRDYYAGLYRYFLGDWEGAFDALEQAAKTRRVKDTSPLDDVGALAARVAVESGAYQSLAKVLEKLFKNGAPTKKTASALVEAFKAQFLGAKTDDDLKTALKCAAYYVRCEFEKAGAKRFALELAALLKDDRGGFDLEKEKAKLLEYAKKSPEILAAIKANVK